MERDAKIWVAGHRGLVGSAIVRALEAGGYENLVLRTHDELDLTDPVAVDYFFEAQRPKYVFLAAAKVGGIWANQNYPANFIHQNLAIATAVIHAAHHHGVDKLLNLGSSCIYPRLARQPIRESELLAGPLESTNRAYAVAKIAAIEMCDAYRQQFGCDFISAMPTNVYGPGDNFDLKTAHVVPAVIRKVYEAKLTGADQIRMWGTGAPRREVLYVDDLADACLFLMNRFSGPGPINVGRGEDLTIFELTKRVCYLFGWRGDVAWDTSKPDGTLRKRLDVSKLRDLGWSPRVSLDEGLAKTAEWYASSVTTP